MTIVWVILAVIIFIVIGSVIDNSKPVTSWSDDKLQRLLSAYTKLNKWDKVSEIDSEIKRRMKINHAAENLTGLKNGIYDQSGKIFDVISKIAHIHKISMVSASEIYHKEFDSIVATFSENQQETGEAHHIALSRMYDKYIGVRAMTPRRVSTERRDDVTELASRRLEVENEKNVFIEQARSLMPDRDATLRRLLERYSWQQLLMSMSMSKLHIELLRDVKSNPKVTLPNLRSKTHSRLERQAIDEAHKLARMAGDQSLWDSLIQVPTTDTLSDLKSHSLITTDPIVNEVDRNYNVKITQKGCCLIDLDNSYSNITSSTISSSLFIPLNEKILLRRLFTEIIENLD